jgi:integrase
MRSTSGTPIAPGLKQTGPKTYQSRVKVRDVRSGKEVERVETHRDVPNARAAMRAHEAFHAEVTKAAKAGEEWTLGEAIDVYEKELTVGSRRTRRPHTKRFRAKHGDRRLSQISGPEWSRLLRALECSDNTANLYLDTLRGVYRTAKEHGRLVGDNTSLEVPARRTRRDEAAEYKRAQKPAGPGKALLGESRRKMMEYFRAHCFHLHQLFHLMFLLGLRWSEGAGLQWDDIDWDTGLVHIRRIVLQERSLLTLPKTKDTRVTCLGPKGLMFLRAHRAWVQKMGWPGWELWVFPRPPYKDGRPAPSPQIFDLSEPPLPGYLLSYQKTLEAFREALAATGVQLVGATKALRHGHVTMTEGTASDERERQAQLAMTGHGEDARKTYVGDPAHAAMARKLGARNDAILAGGTPGGTRSQKPLDLRDN